jgi:hypothetical protein
VRIHGLLSYFFGGGQPLPTMTGGTFGASAPGLVGTGPLIAGAGMLVISMRVSLGYAGFRQFEMCTKMLPASSHRRDSLVLGAGVNRPVDITPPCIRSS